VPSSEGTSNGLLTHDVLAKDKLRFIGQYPTDNGRGSFRLYGRSDCDGCPLKVQCTDTRGRRVKMVLHAEEVDPKPPDPPAITSCPTGQATTGTKAAGTAEGEHPGGPRASITEPEAVMMLATSEKRWEPSYNADLAVTRHGIIVSQFLTKDTTDYHHFQPALRAVTSTLGKPESWIGDGHYGTRANVLLADREGVFLYAPSASHSSNQDASVEQVSGSLEQPNSNAPRPPIEKFARSEFRHDPEHDVVVCPADQELRFIGVYATDNRRGAYRLYGRSNCRDCSFKSRCTDGTGRRLKIPILTEDSANSLKPSAESRAEAEQDLGRLLEALEARMKEVGDAVLRFRRETVEPTNAHLKQHGVGRFHVRGVARCGAILTLACIAHNLTKWKAREAARSMTKYSVRLHNP
jgi:Transposase DDE domain